jgi:hypothetical protein
MVPTQTGKDARQRLLREPLGCVGGRARPRKLELQTDRIAAGEAVGRLCGSLTIAVRVDPTIVRPQRCACADWSFTVPVHPLLAERLLVRTRGMP